MCQNMIIIIADPETQAKTATINEATAILHQGRNKQKAKLNKMVSIKERKNFIVYFGLVV